MSGVPDSAIRAALERLAAAPEDSDAFVILDGDPDRGYYLQFAPGHGGLLHCEAVSNRYLQPPHQLDDEQNATLERLGWRLHEEGGNWACGFEPDFDAILAFARRTFAEVYGVPEQTPLRLSQNLVEETPSPVLRLTTEAGDVWDDPSEDAMFEYMSDLGPGNTWVQVQRTEGEEAFRVTTAERPEHFDVEFTGGSQRSVPYRDAHRMLADWAFDR